MAYLWMFLAGALLCNSIPHLAAGLRGEPFPTPFGRPPGEGKSPPLVNFLGLGQRVRRRRAGGVVVAVGRLPHCRRGGGARLAGDWLVSCRTFRRSAGNERLIRGCP